MTLENFFRENNKLALGFSGGVDSSYLLYAGLSHGADIQPYFIKTAFQPRFELCDALKLTQQLGVRLAVIDFDILSVPAVSKNCTERCYHCKSALFGALRRRAAADGYSVLIDGTNASDDATDRPGMRALCELSVHSPLREAGLEKDRIRRLSKEAGLFTWDKPAYACLATRIACGTAYTADLLCRVEGAEEVLFSLGFSDFRVRVFHGAARLQLPAEQTQTAVALAEEIKNGIKPFFSEILLDLDGR